MAKQTFTVGQVLTAAQLTSLQQTAMGGGAASAKTASYTLVAADAGTTISMTSTSATTVTVNTGLFAAGDTVFIQNLGTGNLTITAGSATVATAGSLILPQNDAGILYFVSTSSSVFYDFIQVGAASPLTTKGDLYTFSTSDTRIGVGANNTVLTADSAEATGLKWATPAGGGMTLLSTTNLSGTTTTISGISGSYVNLFFQIRNADLSAIGKITVTLNGGAMDCISMNSTNTITALTNTWGSDAVASAANICVAGYITNYAGTTSGETSLLMHGGSANTGNTSAFLSVGLFTGSAPITSIGITTRSGTATFTDGSVLLYGVK